MEFLVKNRNFAQQWKCWSKIEILVKIEILSKNQNFIQKSKF